MFLTLILLGGLVLFLRPTCLCACIIRGQGRKREGVVVVDLGSLERSGSPPGKRPLAPSALTSRGTAGCIPFKPTSVDAHLLYPWHHVGEEGGEAPGLAVM